MAKPTKDSPHKGSINPYAKGMTPPKFIKKEVAKTKGTLTHTIYHAETRGQVIDVIYVDSARNHNDDAYIPYTFKLARGQGQFVDSKGKEWEDDTLVNLGISNWHIRRGPDGGRLLNSTVSGDTQWARRAMVRHNTRVNRSDTDIEKDLLAIIKVTKKLNRAIDKNPSSNDYNFAAPVRVLNPNDDNGHLVSLDHYFPDAQVIEILKEYYGQTPIPDFATDNELAASVYFDPHRITYSAQAHQWGYKDKVAQAATDDDSVDMNDLERYRA